MWTSIICISIDKRGTRTCRQPCVHILQVETDKRTDLHADIKYLYKYDMELEPVDSLVHNILYVETDKQEDKQRDIHVDNGHQHQISVKAWNNIELQPDNSLVYSFHMETEKKSDNQTDKQTDLPADIKYLYKYEIIWNWNL